MTRRAGDRTRDRRAAQRAGKALAELSRQQRAADSPAPVPTGAPGTVVDAQPVAAVAASQPGSESYRCARCNDQFDSPFLQIAHTCTPKESAEVSPYRLRCSHGCGATFIGTLELIAHKCPGPPEAVA